MTVSLHKISAGDGYLYLVRQVAASDATHRGRSALADYYSVKGEAPGRWLGKGLTALADPGARDVSAQTVEQVWAVQAGSEVTEDQMKALFGEGLHPNATKISDYLIGRGLSSDAAGNGAKLGRKFAIYDDPPFVAALSQAYRENNIALGEKPSARVDPATKSAIRTRLARDWFSAENGRPPSDDRELSGYLARINRPPKTAVAAFDLAFSPVKSLSAAWAVAPLPIAQVFEDCHHDAVADVVAFLEESVAFTRTGTNGVAQVNTEGLIATAWTHRDSRASDPDLHTHLVISSKIAAVDAHGVRRWLALDAQPLHHMLVSASELYNTRIEHHVTTRLGLNFAEAAPARRGKRVVREIVGIPAELLTRWSSRRAAIETRTAELAKEFQGEHGREPTAVELLALGQQATLETREAKHEPRSLAEQRTTWRSQAIEVLGHSGLTAMLAGLTAAPRRRVAAVDEKWVTEAADAVISVVSESRSRWRRHHVLAEAQRYVRTSGHAAHTATDLAARITAAALTEPLSLAHARIDDDEQGEPVALRRRDGSSVYRRHGAQLYTSAKIVAAEQRILAAAHEHGARRADRIDIDLAIAESAARGKTLNAGQVALVEEMAAGGRRVALALAPAGSGKTTAMAALSQAWRSSGGNVIGLAPTAAAAIELAKDLNAPADTLAKYVHTAAGRPGAITDWFRRIGPDTMVIVDEIGKAGTLELDALIAHVKAKGACVRGIGDDGQLASISAGGILRDIASETGALTLSELVRFHSESEAAATLALRAGDPAGLGFYIDAHRVHVGADSTAAYMAYNAWRADIKAGRDSLLLAPTNPAVNELNARARRDRIADAAITYIGRETTLSDGLAASAGDIIKTRKNNRHLAIGRTDFVRNGYRYTIDRVRADGSLMVTHMGTGTKLKLPADYVTDHVTLGYASTVDLAQGLTAKFACHIVGAASLTRQLLYVALTRGRHENHIYLSTSEQDPHRILSTKATHPETAVEALSAALARDGAQVSATTADRQARDPFRRLGALADMYYDALGTGAEHLIGDQLGHLDTVAEQLRPGLTEAAGWPVLRKHLALLALAGNAPTQVLSKAITARPLDDARDVAAVLDWRIDPTGGHGTDVGPLRWLPDSTPQLRADTVWGPFLQRRRDLVTDMAAQIRDTCRTWTTETAPDWAKALIAANPALTAELAVFRAAHHVEQADTRLLGPEQYPNRAKAIQKLLERHALAALSAATPAAGQFDTLVDQLNDRIRADSYWPQLAARLAAATRIRTDIPALITAAAAQGPLPDELPAAALWWRLAPQLNSTVPEHNHVIDPAAQRTSPQLQPVLERANTLRIQRAAVAAELTHMRQDGYLIGNGPTVAENAAQITQMRQRADADRPYLTSVIEVTVQWADAEKDYDQAIERARTAQAQYETLAADTTADSLDIESARQLARWCEHTVPATTPAERFHPLITAAQQARAEAAGGTDNVISHADVDTYLRTLRDIDDANYQAKRAELAQLRTRLAAAELEVARAYAADQTHAVEHVSSHADLIADELRILAVSGHTSIERPLYIPATDLDELGSRSQIMLPKLARSPFTITPVRAEPGRDTTRALHVLYASAAAADRKVLWCSPTQQGADTARRDGQADTFATTEQADREISQGIWALPAGSFLIVDDAATTNPQTLINLAEHAAAANAAIILLDNNSPGWPPKPSARLLQLLHTDLPWAAALGDGAIAAEPLQAPDLKPLLDQAQHLSPDVLTDELRAAVHRRDRIRKANQSAWHRHQRIIALQTPQRSTSIGDDTPGLDIT
ncbi:TrwC relaxase [Mycobacteroides abscessus subsp. massiliense]|uniref:MobF family relaxase n=1 Tax=Mycobacteroides abscessus TaxID=36809 RepID=UPI0009D0FE5D|nr:MobF family relaxase [Mycobacteroides abscessus]SKL10417.1 TrwC relaxase [Mycobacteroides abscessus subsp. massiliense]